MSEGSDLIAAAAAAPTPSGLTRHWRWLALRGMSALLFALLALVWPAGSVATLVIIWGAYALVDGTLALFNGLHRGPSGQPLWSMVAVGALGLAAGLFTLIWPGLTTLALLLVLGAWAVFMGGLQIVAAIRFRKEIRGEWLLALSGLLSLAFGLLLWLQPALGVVALAWLVAGFALLFGSTLLGLAWRLRRLQRLPLPPRRPSTLP
jgi:uncharacterized membrane protein HdeD (DUF308 family)